MSHLPEDRFDELVAMERSREQAPLNSWAQIARRAREEGLIDHDRRDRWSRSLPWMQAAAGIVVLLGGIAIGRSTTAWPFASAISPDPTTSATSPAATPVRIRTVEDAYATLDRASADYQSASAFLAANNTTGPALADSVSIYRTRLAALEQLMSATATARANAPLDPVINQYYLAALGAREATVQQLGAVQPPSLRLRGF
jgi:hypothetical protein